jgi:hypothetical protein
MKGRFAVAGRAGLALAVAAVLSLSLQIRADDARADEPGPRNVADGPVTKDGKEITALRTRDSRTFRSPTGSFVAVLARGAVNYQDANGQWQPIDNTLVASSAAGAALENKANSYSVRLPHNLRAPVRVDQGSDWLSFTLDDASSAEASASGGTASYAGALPNTTVRYTAAGDLVKEELELASSSAPQAFTFHLRASQGLSATSNDRGGIDIVDGSGATPFSIPAPFMTDAAGATSRAVTYTLASTPDGYDLTVKPDRAWLTAAARKYPVVVDPTLNFAGADYDCYLVSGTPDANLCAMGTNLDVGASGSSVSRTPLKWNLDTIPSSAIVLDAKLSVYLQSAANTTPVVVGAHRVNSAWDFWASWNKRDSTNSWTTPGGDFAANTAGNNTPTTVTAAGAWYSWRYTQLAQTWISGSVPNNGVLLKSEDESVQNLLHFSSSSDYSFLPTLRVIYE